MIPLAARIHSALPQTQCTRCGYPDCAAYAEAVAGGEAAINQCPPGGTEGIERLAALTGRPALPLDTTHGAEGPRTVAVIDEAWCIGCTLCIPACPVDAIMGSNKLMHTVIEPHCTGCELCVAVCPVDCISLDKVTGDRSGWQAWSPAQADEALRRYRFHLLKAATAQADANPPDDLHDTPTPDAAAIDAAEESGRKRTLIEAALARARSQRKK